MGNINGQDFIQWKLTKQIITRLLCFIYIHMYQVVYQNIHIFLK